jgi:hypothetical protein
MVAEDGSVRNGSSVENLNETIPIGRGIRINVKPCKHVTAEDGQVQAGPGLRGDDGAPVAVRVRVDTRAPGSLSLAGVHICDQHYVESPVCTQAQRLPCKLGMRQRNQHNQVGNTKAHVVPGGED